MGKLVKTDQGAIWTIPKEEVKNVKNKKSSFGCDTSFRTDSGFWLGLGLYSPGRGENWWVWLFSLNDVPVRLEATLVIQEELEADVKVTGFPRITKTCPAIKMPQRKLFADTRRALVVEVRVKSCEEDQVAAPMVIQCDYRYTVAATKGEVALRKGEVLTTRGKVVATKVEEKPWSLEEALEFLGEKTTKKKGKESQKTTKKDKKKVRLQERKEAEKESKSTDDEETDRKEDPAQEKQTQRDFVKSLKMKLIMEDEEVEATKTELSQTIEEVDELVEEQRRNRKEQQLRVDLVEEVRSREAMERGLAEQLVEEEGRGRQLEEQLRQVARVGQASNSLLEAATRPGAAHTKEEQEEQEGQEARVVPSSKNLGAIPKTRAAIHKTRASSKKPGASSPPSSKAQKSVERMVRLLEERGRLASLPTSSLRRLVAQLRVRLGGLSDLSLSYVEQEVARMAVDEAN